MEETLAIGTRTYPLSERQRTLWEWQKTCPQKGYYNFPIGLRFHSKPDSAKFKEACSLTLKRYPVLTNLFCESGGVPFQESMAAPSFSFNEEDTGAGDSVDLLSKIRDKIVQPFSPEKGPLIRIHLFYTAGRGAGEAETIVLITIHSILFDENSILPFVTTLMDFYLMLIQGRDPGEDSPHSRESYKDFIHWESAMLGSEKGVGHLSYWKYKLPADFPAFSLSPYNIAAEKMAGDCFRRRDLSESLSRELSRGVNSFARSRRIDLSTFFLGTYQILLNQYTSLEELIVIIKNPGRPLACFDSLIGCFENRLPISCRIIKNQALPEFLEELQMDLADGLDHGFYPFSLLCREMHLSPTGSPDLKPAYSYHSLLRSRRREIFQKRYGDEILIELIDGIYPDGEFDLELEVAQGKEDFVLNLKYNRERFDSLNIKYLMDHYIKLIREIIVGPGMQIGEYTHLPVEKIRRLSGIRAEILKKNTLRHIDLLPPVLEEDGPCMKLLLFRLSPDCREEELLDYLRNDPGISEKNAALLSDYKKGSTRRALSYKTKKDFHSKLQKLFSGEEKPGPTKLVFVFAGSGEQYAGLGRYLYNHESYFKGVMDKCFDILKTGHDLDLKELLFAEGNPEERGMNFRALVTNADSNITFNTLDTLLWSHISTFTVEYSLARWYMSKGVFPDAVIGHSLGEYVAACLAGVFPLKEALGIVVNRARLLEHAPESRMLSVMLSAGDSEKYLDEEITLAVANSKESCVLAGNIKKITALQKELIASYIPCKPLMSERAVHSPLLRKIAVDLGGLFNGVDMLPPSIPMITNLSGSWVDSRLGASPEYWVDHACSPVRFDKGIRTLFINSYNAFLVIGAGNDLCGFIYQNSNFSPGTAIIPSLPAEMNRGEERSSVLKSFEKLWVRGKFPVETDKVR